MSDVTETILAFKTFSLLNNNFHFLILTSRLSHREILKEKENER